MSPTCAWLSWDMRTFKEKQLTHTEMNNYICTIRNSEAQLFCFDLNCVSSCSHNFAVRSETFRNFWKCFKCSKVLDIVNCLIIGFAGWVWSELILNILFWSPIHENSGASDVITFCTWNHLKTICKITFQRKLYNILSLKLTYGYWNILVSNVEVGV
jgi:hypothetical protein